MTTQTQTTRPDFLRDEPWRVILTLAMQVAEHTVTTGERSSESTVREMRRLIESVRAERDAPAPEGVDKEAWETKKASWGRFASYVWKESSKGRFTTADMDPKDRRDTGNEVQKLVLGRGDDNVEAFKVLSEFIGGTWNFPKDVSAVIGRAKEKYAAFSQIDRMVVMRDLDLTKHVNQLVSFIEKQNRRTKKETSTAVNTKAAELSAERDGGTAKAADTLEVQPMEVTTGTAATAAAPAAVGNAPHPATTMAAVHEAADALEPSLEERAIDLQKRIDKLFGEADALRATDKRSKDATAKESEAFGLEDELKAVRAKIDERERDAARVAEETRAASARAAEAARPIVAAQPEQPARTATASLGTTNPMAQIRAAAAAGDDLAKSVIAGYAAGKHPTAERAIQVARDLGVIP